MCELTREEVEEILLDRLESGEATIEERDGEAVIRTRFPVDASKWRGLYGSVCEVTHDS